MDGSEVIRQVRDWSPTPNHHTLRARARAVKVTALDLGADVTKSFGINELLARIRKSPDFLLQDLL